MMTLSAKHGLKAVLDTNVWVSAIIWGGLPASIIKAAENGKVLIIVSEEILQEISKTLAYLRLREIYEEIGVTREELMEAVLRVGKLVKVGTRLNIVPEDPADNKFVECAVDGDTDYVVSGDVHLLGLEHYQRIRMLSVRRFCELLEITDGASVAG